MTANNLFDQRGQSSVQQPSFRVIDVQWHAGHQFEMLKFPFVEWHWLMQYKRPLSSQARGDLRGRLTQEVYYEPGKYDAAILHLDQECLDADSWEFGKGRVYQDMNKVIEDIPKIVIMHGTPYNPGANPPYNAAERMVERVREIIGENHLVVNSHQAARQWGWGQTIVHGLDPAEWWDLPKQPRVLTVLSPRGMDAYYDRPFLEEIKRALWKRQIFLCHVGVDHVAKDWDDYRETLGRSLIYLNPTRESPMPRARTEAMFSGCCVVTTPHHDADGFIEHGVNGFLIERDPEQAADLIAELINDPRRAEEIGRKGRETACQRFHWNRFADTWKNLLTDVVPGHQGAASVPARELTHA